ncbi:unnamed protein product [Phytophthora fragariaefolia]|uniref:Unnamed protein product n=1 Tax=Phytophthora fragariaefolia TaxID=1490495 RepID=A0A9W7D1H7_9STRA|nr:unnamed protein product [Phytophthora fragariaefolia]
MAGWVTKGVCALMLTYLHRDVDAGMLDPATVYRKLYPHHIEIEYKDAATAARFAHYERERSRPTDSTVPSSFWVGPHELRAMAQYIKEPLLVLDGDRKRYATLQKYAFQTHRLRNGEDHESGSYEALTADQARAYLHACWTHHVYHISWFEM